MTAGFGTRSTRLPSQVRGTRIAVIGVHVSRRAARGLLPAGGMNVYMREQRAGSGAQRLLDYVLPGQRQPARFCRSTQACAYLASRGPRRTDAQRAHDRVSSQTPACYRRFRQMEELHYDLIQSHTGMPAGWPRCWLPVGVFHTRRCFDTWEVKNRAHLRGHEGDRANCRGAPDSSLLPIRLISVDEHEQILVNLYGADLRASQSFHADGFCDASGRSTAPPPVIARARGVPLVLYTGRLGAH